MFYLYVPKKVRDSRYNILNIKYLTPNLQNLFDTICYINYKVQTFSFPIKNINSNPAYNSNKKNMLYFLQFKNKYMQF